MKKKSDNLAKNVGKISSGTFLSRISGLARDIVLTHFLGATSVADSFGVAFVIPNMLRGLFGEGALSAAFIPLYTEFKEKKSKAETIQFALNILSILIILLIILVGIGIVLAPIIVKLIAPGFALEFQSLTSQLTQTLFPYLFLIGLTSVVIAILNAHSIFFLPSLSPMMFNLGIIIPAIIYTTLKESSIEEKAFILAAGVLFGGICQLSVNLPLLRKIGYKFKFRINLKQKEIKQVWQRMIPGIVGIGIREINVVVDTILASVLAVGSVAALQYGNRLMQLPLGVFGIAIGTALLPLFSRYIANNQTDKLKKSLKDAFNLILIIMLPIIAIILVMGRDMISLIYLHGAFDEKNALPMTFAALLFYSIGLVSHSSVRIFASAFFALKNTKTPMKIAAITVVCNIILNIILMHFIKLKGLALATSISATIQAFILFFVLQKNIGKINFSNILSNFLKICIISILLGFVCFYLNQITITSMLNWRILLFLKILVIMIISSLIYFSGLKFLKVKSSQMLFDIFRRK
ncbi:MAG: murein biosynthesis integral membrane protein MurJ [Candidatus Cloacimonetes bacterium]|nr:murein biosynthesis integral membrane protein MurJ [Candidatus Cloacimonadota bacterium]MBL7108231.1 murein biosynthesis integral membrane protein MurJ [Candidatus Cloacimonadota bacterium]